MVWRKIKVSALMGVAATLAATAGMASGSDVAQETSGSGLPRLEFEMPLSTPRQSVVVPRTLRGVMGYRLPLVSRQVVPGQVVSGGLIPAHITYVILEPGYWELVGLSPGEMETLRPAATANAPAEPEPPSRRWNLLRLFRRTDAK